jgi:V/A-type H+-transporting ATPase subunit I
MALVEMKKVELALHRSVTEKVVASLQRLGCCEIIGCGGDNTSGETKGGPVSEHLKRYENLLSDARFTLRFLENYRQGKVSFLARALSEKPHRNMAELESLSDETDFQEFVTQIRGLERQFVEIRTEMSQLAGLEAILGNFRDLSQPLLFFTTGTEKVKGVMGTMPVDQISRMELAFSSQIAQDGELFVTVADPAKDKDAKAALLYLRELDEKVSALCAEVSFNRIELPRELSGTALEEIARIGERKALLLEKEEDLTQEAGRLSSEWLDRVQALSDFWTVMKGRYETLDSSESTEQINFLRFWAPADALQKIEKELEPFNSLSDKTVKAPEKGEVVPSMLRNPAWASPCEPLTTMFGVPTYGGVDPTLMMAPFFYLFFGMCLGDAGFGVILALILGGVLLKFPIAGNLRKFLIVMFICSLSTIVMGALTGSWLANTMDSFEFLGFLRPLRDRFVVWDPMNDPMTYLGVCLTLGFAQLIFGLGIAFWDALRRRSYVEAFADRGGWIMLLVGVALLFLVSIGKAPASLGLVAKALAAGGAIVLFLTQGRSKKGLLSKAFSGALSLYGITSYLGDTLSYSRLLALGLSGAAIGLIINLLAKMISEGVPYVGWILALILFVIGNIFSLAINVLGAFVHSLRLQYVEFFSKFYEANGRIFSPFGYETQFVKIVEAGDSHERN